MEAVLPGPTVPLPSVTSVIIPSSVLLELMVMVTKLVGSLVRTTVKVAVPPASVVKPVTLETVMSAMSSSVMVSAIALGTWFL